MVPSAKGPKAKFKPALFQPLNRLELVYRIQQKDGLQQLQEASLDQPYKTLHSDFIKYFVTQFINEVIDKSLKEDYTDEQMFDFLMHELDFFDTHELNPDYHLFFLMGLSRHLGFFPDVSTRKSGKYFNLKEGVFTTTLPSLTNSILDEETSGLIAKILEEQHPESKKRKLFSLPERKKMLSALLDFYSLHVANFNDLKTVKVLKEVF
jgi:DNA repair protein RecO (recombination protein O)